MTPDPVFDLAVSALTVSAFFLLLCLVGVVVEGCERVGRRWL